MITVINEQLASFFRTANFNDACEQKRYASLMEEWLKSTACIKNNPKTVFKVSKEKEYMPSFFLSFEMACQYKQEWEEYGFGPYYITEVSIDEMPISTGEDYRKLMP